MSKNGSSTGLFAFKANLGEEEEDNEAEESSGTESEDKGKGKELTAEQKRIKTQLDLDTRYEINRQRALKKHR